MPGLVPEAKSWKLLRFPYSLASNSAEELGLTASIMVLWTCARMTMS